jgi:hypothetical protein
MAYVVGGQPEPDYSAALNKAIADDPRLMVVLTKALKKICDEVVAEQLEKSTAAELAKAGTSMAAMHARLDKVIEQCSPKLPNYAPEQPNRRWEN